MFDVLGNKIKKLPHSQYLNLLNYFSKYYVHNYRVFQIIRVEEVLKLNAVYYTYLTQPVIGTSSKIREFTLPRHKFLEIKFFSTFKGALRLLKHNMKE